MEETLISTPPSVPSDYVPNLPFDLVEEILARLPVKFLLQFRCVCKSWNSLITDNSKFAKKHLRFSKTNNRLLLNALSRSKNTIPTNYILKSYPTKATFTTTTATSNTANQLHCPHNWQEFPFYDIYNPIIGSCDGILCFARNDDRVNFAFLWNPSIRKSNELPPLENPNFPGCKQSSFGFGYDSLSDNYKVVVIISYHKRLDFNFENQVKVHSLGTNFWRTIQDFPYVPCGQLSGIFVGGKLNWLTTGGNKISSDECIIVSLDLGNESYQEVLQPHYREEVDVRDLIIGVLNDCLSMLSRNALWVMKEYGNKESWTKIFTLPSMEDYVFTKAIYIFEDHQLLLGACGEMGEEFAVYDSKSGGNVKFYRMDNNPVTKITNSLIYSVLENPNSMGNTRLELSLETLISP